MKITYSAKNINCQNCANTIKNALGDDYEGISIDLTKNPKEVSVNLNSKEEEERFVEDMNDLGFEVIEEISRS